MDKWEYTLLFAREGNILRKDYKTYPRGEESRLMEFLYIMGRQGWEVVTYQKRDQGIESVFLKRKLEDPAENEDSS